MVIFKKLIKVLIVEDSSVVSKVLVDIMKQDPEIVVLGVAHNGEEAIELTIKLKPDIITMDLDLPVMDGLEATKQIMAYQPTPILVLSSAGFKERMPLAFKAISYGALEIWEKGFMEEGSLQSSGDDLLSKIKFLVGIKVIHHPLGKLQSPTRQAEAFALWIEVDKIPKTKLKDRVVAIVSSTGGPAALLRILKMLPKNFPCPIFIVQHITTGFGLGLVDWFNSECEIEVKTPQDNTPIEPGVVYVAPEEFHMRVTNQHFIKLSKEEPSYNVHKPSGDILLESIGKVYKEGAIGIILTGMGDDGARGIKVIKENNGKTIAQDEKSSVVFGMPKAAIDMKVVDKVLALDEIPLEIMRLLKE